MDIARHSQANGHSGQCENPCQKQAHTHSDAQECHRALGEYEEHLLNYATEQLSKIEGIRFIGQAPKRSGLVSFLIGDIHPYDLGTLVDKMGVALRTGHHCAEPVMTFFDIPGTVRASFAIYNTTEEIDIFIKAVEKAANMLR